MNYLTNYYKNLSEQLQERVNHLQNLLEKRKSEDVLVTGYEVTSQPTGPANMKIHGVLTKGKGAKRGREVVANAGDVYAGHKMLGDVSHSTIGTSETPEITIPSRDLTPDHYDSNDEGLRADTDEVLQGKTVEQMRALLPKKQGRGEASDEWEHHSSYEGKRSWE